MLDTFGGVTDHVAGQAASPCSTILYQEAPALSIVSVSQASENNQERCGLGSTAMEGLIWLQYVKRRAAS